MQQIPFLRALALTGGRYLRRPADSPLKGQRKALLDDARLRRRPGRKRHCKTMAL
ncbi:MAG: hypothetical protein WBX11_08170 [Thiobacillaceae bacterium]